MESDSYIKISEKAESAQAAISDHILECLALITGLLNRPISATSLASGLPLPDEGINDELCVRAAKRAGFFARSLTIPLADISNLTLPCILILNGSKACILKKINEETDKDNKAEVFFPGSDSPVKLDIDELEEQYTGKAVFVKIEKEGLPAKRQQPGQWFWQEILQNKYIIAQVIGASLAINVLTLAVPLFVMNVYDRVVPNNAMETLWVLAIGAAVALGFDFVLKNIRYYFIDHTGRNLDIILSAKIYEKLMKISSLQPTGSSGNLANRIRSFESLRDFFSSATLATFVDLPFALLFIAVITYFGGFGMGAIPLTTGLLIMATGVFFHGHLLRFMSAYYMQSAQKHGFLVESIQRMETIKCLGVEGSMQRKWEKVVDASADSAMQERRLSSLFTFLAATLGNISYITLIVVGAYKVSYGDITMGGLIACAILNGRTMAPFLQTAGILARMQKARVAFSSLSQLMKMPEERAPERQFLYRPSIKADIEFQNIFFRYPNQNQPALKNLQFKIKEGERVAILGKSGSGKSTLCKLIVGLYPPVSGSLLIDNTDIRQLNPADLRKITGYVPQSSHLFSGTLRYNLALGSDDTDDESLMKALSMTGLDDQVRQHPMGLDRDVGSGGDALSAGEKQAVCIARSLVSANNILLFDEPTAFMDNVSEQVFIKNMKNKLDAEGGKTTFMLITQKFAPLRLVDRIIVINNGMITADGPRDEILQKLKNGK